MVWSYAEGFLGFTSQSESLHLAVEYALELLGGVEVGGCEVVPTFLEQIGKYVQRACAIGTGERHQVHLESAAHFVPVVKLV